MYLQHGWVSASVRLCSTAIGGTPAATGGRVPDTHWPLTQPLTEASEGAVAGTFPSHPHSHRNARKGLAFTLGWSENKCCNLISCYDGSEMCLCCGSYQHIQRQEVDVEQSVLVWSKAPDIPWCPHHCSHALSLQTWSFEDLGI